MNPLPAECKSLLAAEYQTFLTTCADLEIMVRTIRSATSIQHKQSHENQKRLIEAGLCDLSSSHHNMSFRSFIDGKHIFYESRSRTPEQIRAGLIEQKNKAYQWVVAEAYEAFEDFIDICYACGQYGGLNLWKPAQLRSVAVTGGATPSLSDLWKAASNAKLSGNAFNKISRFRSVCPRIQKVELGNPICTAPKMMLALIELLRHVIVHNAGRIKSRADFERRVLTKAGVFNNGRPKPENVSEINLYLAVQQDRTIVRLTEANVPNHFPGAYTDRVGVLVGVLLAYAHLIASEALLGTTATPAAA